MSRTGGEKTKMRILEVAEKLFAENGVDATSVDKIAREAKVNKALIYYHFKNKNDIVVSLVRNIIEEIDGNAEKSLDTNKNLNPGDELKEEITFLGKKKRILSVMLMESFKLNDKDNYLFKSAEMVIEHEQRCCRSKEQGKEESSDKQRHFVHEFFTGVLPLVAFVALQDKWCEYYKCEPDKLLEYFVDVFLKSHVASQLGPG